MAEQPPESDEVLAERAGMPPRESLPDDPVFKVRAVSDREQYRQAVRMSVSESLILWQRWRIRLSQALLASQITERECAEVLVRWTLAEENTVHRAGNIRCR